MPIPFRLPSLLRSTLLAFALATLALGGQAATLKLAVSSSPLSLPIFVAQAEGYFAAEGLEVTLVDCLGGSRCIREVIDGRADFATVSDVPIALNAFASSHWAIVATIATSTDDLKLIARKAPGLVGPGQLAGQRIGMVKASHSQYFLETFLLANDIDPAAIRTVPLQPEQLVSALAEGRVDAIVASEPFGFAALRALNGAGQVLPGGSAYRRTWNLVMHRRLVEPPSPEVPKLLKALDRAEHFIQQQPARAQALLRTHLDADAALVDWIWPQMRYRLSLDQGLLKALESEARWAVREGHVPGQRTPNFLPLFHPAPLVGVKPDAAGITR